MRSRIRGPKKALDAYPFLTIHVFRKARNCYDFGALFP
jgi:hypothetical protein